MTLLNKCEDIAAIDHCLTYEDLELVENPEHAKTNECTSCEPGYFLQNSSTCDPIQTSNCDTQDEDDQCTKCEDGYYLKY